MYKVYLKPGKEESLKRFHPWVFSGAIAHFDGEPEEGEVVEIYTSKKEFIAKDISKSAALPSVYLASAGTKLSMPASGNVNSA